MVGGGGGGLLGDAAGFLHGLSCNAIRWAQSPSRWTDGYDNSHHINLDSLGYLGDGRAGIPAPAPAPVELLDLVGSIMVLLSWGCGVGVGLAWLLWWWKCVMKCLSRFRLVPSPSAYVR